MERSRRLIPETRVLAIASHVVFGYVGNKVATFVMQALGCDVSALNTVNFSNHTGYGKFKGTKTSPDQIWELFQGLEACDLADFHMLLSGYLPSPEAVETVGRISRELRLAKATKPGSFFWALDPVLGDNGALYVPVGTPEAYLSVIHDCDLILPNQFELETLTATSITSLSSLTSAVSSLHSKFRLPHVFVTSTSLPDGEHGTITLVGSTATKEYAPRLFRIDVPYFDAYFTGTGDCFAALIVARLREQTVIAGVNDIAGWISPDEVTATELPLAKAAEMAVASMHAVLNATFIGYEEERKKVEENVGVGEKESRRKVKLMKAVELRVVRNVGDLIEPSGVERFRARAVEVHGNEK